MSNQATLAQIEYEQLFRDVAQTNAQALLNELGDDLASIERLLDICSTSEHCPRVYAAYQWAIEVAAIKYAKRMVKA